MQKLLRLTLMSALLFAAATESPAMISIAQVSKERAKELGIQLCAKPNGPNEIWIELQFKPVGRLAAFQHVGLEVCNDKQFLMGWTALKDTRSRSGDVIVRLMGNRDFLANVTLRIVSGPFSDFGHDLRINDFVDWKQLK